MPSAGAIVPPIITPLRKVIPGKPSTLIDTATFIELSTDSTGCKLYFTSDGTKPNPFQCKVGGREITFRYKGPFSLKAGKRLIKAVAVSRDGLQESNVVSKTFTVEEVGLPPEDLDLDNLDLEPETDNNAGKTKRPRSASKRKKTTQNGKPKEAWASSTNTHVNNLHNIMNGTGELGTTSSNNSVQLPDGPFNPTNYSGTQVNFWGVSPGQMPGLPGGGYSMPGGFHMPYQDKPSQLGYVTEQTIRNLEAPKLTIRDVKQLMEDVQKRTPPPPEPTPAIEYPAPDPEAKPCSPGEGDWKGQLEHIYAHLIKKCKSSIPLRTAIAEPKMAEVIHADFDEEDDAYLLTVAISKFGVKAKPRPKKQPPAPAPVEPKPRPKPVMANTVKKVQSAQKVVKTPPKKEPAKPKPKPAPKEEPYFETEEYEQEGTMKPWEYFDAESDCEILRKAMKGMGTDEDAIINVMGYRCSTQRQEIVKMFKTMFGKDLEGEFESETSGDFEDILKALCKSAVNYDASEINKAIKGLGTDEDALIEILCTRTNKQIKAMKAAYKKLYGKEMEKDVKGDTSGNFRKLLVAQMSANREENPTFDRTAAKKDAEALHQAGEKKWGTDESTFNMILCQRSFPHLRAVFEEYEKLSKKTMVDAIKSEFSGDIKDGFVTVVRCIQDKPGYFARKMQKAMKGLGTDDSALIRVAVSRCECDMVQIKEAFERDFKGSLGEWIKDDTSGDYSQILLALVGERVAPSPTAEEVEAAQGEPEIEEVEEENIPQDPTIKDASPFDPKKDCEVLKKAMKGFGTDEDAIIEVWARRSNKQRLEINKMYRTMFGKDLLKELKSELSGNLKDTVLAMGQAPNDYDANEMRKAMKGLGTDEDTLIEILCTRDNEQIAALKEAYTKLHNRKLEEDIESETSGHLKRLLVSMVQANRPSGNTIDRRKARKDATALLEAGDKKWGTDESRFNVILCSRSNPQLRATFEEYNKAAGKDIEESIEDEMSGDLKNGMLTIIRCVRNKSGQFASRLHKAMKGLGTDDDTLVRICVSRSEIDMVQIKQAFESAYQQPLGKFIADDISGDYRKIILTLIAEEQFKKK